MIPFPLRIPAIFRYRRNHTLIAIGTVAVVALLCAPLAQTDNYHLVPYLLLFVVSILATFMSVIPVLIASTLSAMVWNFFFIPPHYTFHIEKPEDILLFGMFFMIAMLNGVLTSKIRQTAELEQKAQFLDQSDRLYKTLFNSISHELRIPVSTIMAASENLVTSKYPPEIQAELNHEIFTASIRLNRVIENLLSMSRLETGRISVKPDWHDINDLVNKVLSDLGEELSNFTVTFEVPDDMPPVRIDFGLMEQVLYNLLFNSGQHAPAGSEISIRAAHTGSMLVMEVTDRGPGFPEDKIGQVFDKFFRIEESKPGGLGLGLSIVKGFIEAHKGTIDIENVASGGARFTIRIPSPLTQITNIKP